MAEEVRGEFACVFDADGEGRGGGEGEDERGDGRGGGEEGGESGEIGRSDDYCYGEVVAGGEDVGEIEEREKMAL